MSGDQDQKEKVGEEDIELKKLRSMLDTRNLFDKGIDSARWLLKKGYTQAWFTWLEWVTITAFFLALSIQVGSILLGIVSFGSGVLLFFTGLASALDASLELGPKLEKAVSKKWFFAFALIFIIAVPTVAFQILFGVLEGIVKN